MKLKQKLVELGACLGAIRWVGDKTLKEAWETCERGDWMLWLAFSLKDNSGWSDIKEITLAKVKCARLVQHLMKDQRSIDVLDVAERWARGQAIDEELKNAAYAAAAYADAAAYAAADAAAYTAAAYAATYAVADAAAYAVYAAAVYAAVYAAAAAAAYAAADVADDAAAADAAARGKVLKQCADICRETLKIGRI